MLFSSEFASVFGAIVPFLFVLSIVIFFHELGHFLVGRMCGVRIDAFSLGFGPEVAAFVDRKGTRWRIGILPLGGYVKFHGDPNGASLSDAAAVAAMPEAEKSTTFLAQKVWKRAVIVAAGPIANFILAIVIFTGIYFVHGRGILVPEIDKVMPGSAAQAAGFVPGDIVVSIDGAKIESFEDMQRIVQTSSDTPLSFVVERHGHALTLVATPRRRDVTNPLGTSRVGVLGVEANASAANWHIQRYGIVDSAKLATNQTWFIIEQTGSYAGRMITGRESTDELSGPIRIAEVSGQMAKIGLAALLNLAAVLSISVGILNLLPIPLLDGGHLFYYA
ncbi:MAG: M50 family metallopeptidase, partial [Xanthobacteraceae bacterium]